MNPEMAINPMHAAQGAAEVARVALASTERDADGVLLDAAGDFRPNRNVILSFDDDGAPRMWTADIRTPGNYYPPRQGDDALATLRRSHVVVPVTALSGFPRPAGWYGCSCGWCRSPRCPRYR